MKPPRYEMTLRADKSNTPPNLILPVTITGVKKRFVITLERAAQPLEYNIIRKEPSLSSQEELGKLQAHIHEDSFAIYFISDTHDKYMCQVFYHKIKFNNWIVSVLFFSKEQESKLKLVNTIYYLECIHCHVHVIMILARKDIHDIQF